MQFGGSAQETPNSFTVERKDGNLNIDWWFPPTANAQRSFVVRYRVVGGLRYYLAGDQLYWKAVYADRPLPVGSSRVAVVFPADLPAEQVKMASYPEHLGVQGRLVDPRTVVFEARDLPAETGLEVRVQFPFGLVDGRSPEWQAAADRADWFRDSVRPPLNVFLALTSLLLLVLGTLQIVLRWRSLGRDPGVRGVPRLLSEPPGDLPPGVAGVLVDERANIRDVVATLIDLARRRLIRIVEEGPPDGKDGRRFRLERLRDEPDDLRAHERLMFRYLFVDGASVRLDELRPRLLEIIPEVQRLLYQEVVETGLFQANPEAVRNRYLIIGGVTMGMSFALVGVLVSVLTDILELAWTPFAAVGLLGAIQMVAAVGMPRRTATGALQAARWRAFARYLQQQQSPVDLAPHLDRFDTYLPYAVALGADREWIKKFAAAGASAPTWYEGWPTSAAAWHPLPHTPGDRSQTGESGNLAEASGGLQWLSDRGALGLQGLSEGFVDMLNSASRTMAAGGGGGGWSGGGSGGGGGGGGGSGGFS